MKKRIIAMILAVLLIAAVMPTALAQKNESPEKIKSYKQGQFTDVAADSWYAENVKTAYELGLMNGNSASTFNPEGEMSVLEAIVIACRINSIYYENGEDFVGSGAWYQPYIDYAGEHGMIYIGTEMPENLSDNMLVITCESLEDLNEPASRAGFAMILASALPDAALSEINTVAEGAIPDVLLDYGYADSIYKLYRAGILTGSDAKGTFGPDDTILRGAAAAIATRMVDTSLRRTVTLDKVDFQPVPMDKLANYSSIVKKMNEEQLKQAYEAALEIVRPVAKYSRENQLYWIAVQLRAITESGLEYSMSEDHYNDPYGFFVLGTASCAGCTRATGLCLNILGIPYEHVNENQYSHQWCRVPVGDEYWICDAFGLYCGPEPAEYKHPYLY